MKITHQYTCDNNAIRCAVENLRESLLEFSPHAEDHSELTPLQTLELVLEWARSYQYNGDVTCTCAADELRKVETHLTTARRALRTHVTIMDSTADAAKHSAKVAMVQGLLAVRDELKAYVGGTR